MKILLISKYNPDKPENIGGPQGVTKELYNSIKTVNPNVILYSYKKKHVKNRIVVAFKFMRDIFLLRNKVDIVNIDTSSMNLAILFGVLNFFLKIPSVLTIHGFPKADKSQKGLKQLMAEIRFFLLLLLYHNIVTVSKTLKLQLLSSFANLNRPKYNIQVIHNGVKDIFFNNEEVFTRKINTISDGLCLFFVGGIKEIKGIFFILEVLSCLKDKVNFNLIIAGNHRQEDLKKFRFLIEKLFLQNYIKIIGWKTEKELLKYYLESDLVIAPSRYETFNVSVLEGMACGKVVICTDTSGVSEILENWYDSLIISYGDTKSFYDSIWKIHENPKLKVLIENNARTKANKYKWDQVALNYLKIYKTILSHI